MKGHLQLFAYTICLTIAGAISVDTVLAQQPGVPGPPPIRDPKSGTRDRQDREATLRSAELGATVGKMDQKRIDAAIEQMKQDFRRIQIVRNEMVRNILANKPFDYKVISEEVGEVNKRADRLKTALMAPSPQEKEKTERPPVEFADNEMKGALVKLCNLIDSFVENPILKNPGTTDVQQSAKANADLLKIIDLSDNLRRNAERLQKSPK